YDRAAPGHARSSGYSLNSNLGSGYKGHFSGDVIAYIERELSATWYWDIQLGVKGGNKGNHWWTERQYIGKDSCLRNVRPAIDFGNAKPDRAELIDVAFNHDHAGQAGANYVTVDGRVGWISSNDMRKIETKEDRLKWFGVLD
ncbi:MAG: hypothetical protein GX811_12170, partial [Lentisphaerae bacterium]|nr:hypothetical protein [Lentisphaerota bacterium]